MTTTETTTETPFHLQGLFAPVTEEVTRFDLPTEGAVPKELSGRYLRNGPNPKTGQSTHWFLGDGMVHGVELSAGRARWYRNRWVRTASFTGERPWPSLGPDGRPDLSTGPANTHVIAYAGRILALVESSLPTEMTPDLETVGPYDFAGRLTTAMTAHPKECPTTGELHFFGYSFLPPYLTYHRADAAGNLVHSQDIEVPGPTMIHDFAITDSHVVFMDLPVVFDLRRAAAGTMPYRWSDDYGARVAILPRDGSAAVTWFEVEPCYVFHTLNAFDDDGRVVVDVVRYPELWRDSPDVFSPATLHRWIVDPLAGKVREEQLDDRPVEFPRVDGRRVGLPHRFGYAVSGLAGTIASDDHDATALVKFDLARGVADRHPFAAGLVPGEGVFISGSDATGEDDGWVLTIVSDRTTGNSQLVILDAGDLAAAPVATVTLPQRVPLGFHGSWIPDDRLFGAT